MVVVVNMLEATYIESKLLWKMRKTIYQKRTLGTLKIREQEITINSRNYVVAYCLFSC